jgi:hypothetical protein
VILENIMSLIKTTSTLPLFVVLAVLAAGCGSTDQAANMEPQEKRELTEIFGMYRMYLKTHNQQPPEKLSDLEQAKALGSPAPQLVREGKYVVVWGTKNKDAETVLAYEKDAPTNGGWALMADGTVKRLDAEAFQSVPMPQK